MSRHDALEMSVFVGAQFRHHDELMKGFFMLLKLLTIGMLAVTATSMSACLKVAEYKAPELKTPVIEPPVFKPPVVDTESLKAIFVCDQITKDIDEEINKHAIKIQGHSDLQDVESTNCDGKKSLSPKMPLQNFSHNLAIAPPENLNSKVTSASIENTRTCSKRQLTIDPSPTEPSLTSAKWRAHPYWLSDSGTIVIGLNDNLVKFSIGLNVLNGQNLITIIYYGECQGELNQNGVCENPKELARKTVLIDASIEVRELNGIRAVNTCTETSKPKAN